MNFPKSVDNELASNFLRAFTKNNSFLTFTIRAFFYNLSSALASASAHNQVARFTNKNLQRAIKLALDSFFRGQKYNQVQAATVSALDLIYKP